MKGLIIKDLINIKKQSKVFLALLAFYTFFAITTNNISMLGSMIILICALMPITTMAYDEQCNWDKYAVSLPLSRKTIILSKYIFAIALNFFAFLTVISLSILINLYTKEMIISEIFMMSAILSGIGLLFLAIILPILIRYGVEKARMLMLILFFLPTLFIMMLSKFDINLPSQEDLLSLAYLVPLFIIVLMLISIKTSIRIYNKKQF